VGEASHKAESLSRKDLSAEGGKKEKRWGGGWIAIVAGNEFGSTKQIGAYQGDPRTLDYQLGRRSLGRFKGKDL